MSEQNTPTPEYIDAMTPVCGAPPVATEEPEESSVTRNNGRYNRSAIKRHALKISIETRNGKFRRVSSEFLDNVEAMTEAKLLTFRREYLAFNGHQVDVEDGVSFLTGEGKARLIAAFNIWIANEIHRQTKDVKIGKTF